MKLYHLHLLGHYDKLYKPNSELIIDKDKFNNRLYTRVYNMNSTVKVSDYRNIVTIINNMLAVNGYGIQFVNRINLGEIIGTVSRIGCSESELRQILSDSEKMLLDDGINLREMAMEEYRKNNCPELPSRMHSLFACSEEGVNYWIQNIYDNSLDVYKIDVLDEPFVSNEVLLPNEGLSYGEKIDASYKYFHPKNKDLNPETNEYLVQGKVKILEKVYEVKK